MSRFAPLLLLLCSACFVCTACSDPNSPSDPEGTAGTAGAPHSNTDPCKGEGETELVLGVNEEGEFTLRQPGDELLLYFGSQAGLEIAVDFRGYHFGQYQITSLTLDLSVDGISVANEASPGTVYKCDEEFGSARVYALISTSDHPDYAVPAQLNGVTGVLSLEARGLEGRIAKEEITVTIRL